MTFEPQKQRAIQTLVVVLSVFAVLWIGAALAVTEAGRPPAAFFDGEWTWVSSQGDYFDIEAAWYPDSRESLSLTFSRGRFVAESRGFVDDATWEMVDRRTTEGTYVYGDTVIASVPRGFVGRPLELSSWIPLLLGTTWVPQVRGDTLTLYAYADDGADYTFVRRERVP